MSPHFQGPMGKGPGDEGCGALTVHLLGGKALCNFLKVKEEIKGKWKMFWVLLQRFAAFFGQLQGENKCLIS